MPEGKTVRLLSEVGCGWSWAAGRVVVVAEVFVAEALASAAVAVGEDVPALVVFGLDLWHEWGPPPPKVCKVRTDKDLSLDFD